MQKIPGGDLEEKKKKVYPKSLAELKYTGDVH